MEPQPPKSSKTVHCKCSSKGVMARLNGEVVEPGEAGELYVRAATVAFHAYDALGLEARLRIIASIREVMLAHGDAYAYASCPSMPQWQ